MEIVWLKNIKKEGNGNLQTCAKICLNTPECIGIQTDHHFKYNCEIVIEGDPKSCASGNFEYHKRECLVYKNSVAPALKLSKKHAHVKDMCTEIVNSRYEPLGRRQHVASDSEGCASLCAADDSCIGSSFFEKNRQCWLADMNAHLVFESFVGTHSCRSQLLMHRAMRQNGENDHLQSQIGYITIGCVSIFIVLSFIGAKVYQRKKKSNNLIQLDEPLSHPDKETVISNDHQEMI